MTDLERARLRVKLRRAIAERDRYHKVALALAAELAGNDPADFWHEVRACDEFVKAGGLPYVR